MTVITRRQLRSLSYRNAISVGEPSEDTFTKTMQESDDVDDPMDGSFEVLCSSEGDEHESTWDEPESGASEEDEESDDPEADDDYEGTLTSSKATRDANCIDSYAPHGKTH
jgi:hypothetical protein